MLGGLYGDLPPPTDDEKPSANSSVWSSSTKMAPPALRKPAFAPPQTILRPLNKPKPIASQYKGPSSSSSQSVLTPANDAATPSQPALVGLTSSVIEEYDPARPNDYEEYRREKKRKAMEAEMKRELDKRRNEEEEREKREREEREKEREREHDNNSESRLNISGEEAWKRRAAMSDSSGKRRSTSPPGNVDGFSIGKSETSGLGVGAGGQMTAAQRMMAKMGWKQGQGLGKLEQGITTPLMAKKTDRRAGVIVNASENKSSEKKVKSVNFNGEPTRVLLLRNMLRHIARSFYKIKIGSGHIARFWSDPWTDMGALSAVLGEGGIAALGILRHATVASAVRNNNWNFRRVRDPSIQAVINSITRMQPPHAGNDQDRHLWRQGHDVYNDHFTSKNTWDQIRSRKPMVTWSCLIWFSQRVPRFSFILWLAIRDRLSTGSRMRTWGISQGCSFCNDPDETRDHLFFACPYSQEIWKQLSSSIVPGTTQPTWNSVTQYIMSRLPTHLDKLLLKIIFQATVYYIWKERNNRIHAETPKSAAVLISFLRSHITTHIQALDYRHPHRLATLHDRWLHH